VTGHSRGELLSVRETMLMLRVVAADD